MKRRMKSRAIAIAVALAGLAAVVALADARGIAGAGLTHLIRAAGFPTATVDLHRLSWSGAVASIRLDAEGNRRVDRVVAAWSLNSLLKRRLERLDLEGVRLRLTTGPGGASGMDGAGLPVPPIDQVVLKNAVVEVVTAAGVWSLPLEGWLNAAPDGPVRAAVAVAPVDGIVDGLAGGVEAAITPEPAGPPTLAVTLTLRVEDLAGTAARLGWTVPWAGWATLALEAAGPMPAGNAGGWLDGLTLAGTAVLRGGGGVPGRTGPLSVNTQAAVALADGVMRLTPDGCLLISGGPVVLGQAELRPPAPACLEGPPGRPFLSVALTGPPAGRTELHGRLAGGGAAELVSPGRDGAQPWRFAGTLADLAVDVDTAATTPLTGRVTVEGFRLDGDPPPVVPLRVDASLTLDAGGRLSFAAEGRDASGALSVAVTGHHDTQAGAVGQGEAEVRVKPITVAPDGRAADSLFPIARDTPASAAGTVALDGRITWGDAETRIGASLLLRDVAVDTGAIAAEGINGVVRIGGLAPLVVPAGQELAIGLLDVGVPLTQGVVRFGVHPGGVLDVDRAEWRWAGGVVRAAPFKARLFDLKGSVVLEAEGLNLNEVLALAAVEGLTATGTLKGQLPVRSRRGRFSITDGVLEAIGPGTLRYDPAAPPSFLQGDSGSGTALLMGALTNFQYETLKMTINGTAGGETKVGLAIRGANPDFYGGYPVALNLNVTGALDTILRSGLRTYRIPEAVRERMMDFERHGQ